MLDLWANIISALMSSFIVYPFDVIKSQLQVLKTDKIHGDDIKYKSSRNIKNVVTNIYQQRAFYKGIGSYLTTYPIFWTIFFQTKKYNYDYTNSKYLNSCINTFSSSVIASAIANPFFVIKTRLQNEIIMNKQYKSGFNIFLEILRNEGIKGLCKGLGPTIFNNGKLIVQIPLYEYLKEKSGNVFLSSVSAKFFCAAITYPCDLTRTVQRNSPKDIKAWYLLKNIYLKNGIRGYYHGFVPYTVMAIPNFALMMVFYEYLKNV